MRLFAQRGIEKELTGHLQDERSADVVYLRCRPTGLTCAVRLRIERCNASRSDASHPRRSCPGAAEAAGCTSAGECAGGREQGVEGSGVEERHAG